jgi:hypothetical protein
MSVNLTTNKSQLLLQDARIGDIVFNKSDRSIWGLRHLNGYVSLVRIPPPYKDWHEIYTFPYGEIAYEIDISPDGSLLSTSMAEVDGNQYLQIYEIADFLNGQVKPTSQYDFGSSVPEGFVFSPDGKYLFGSSFYTGVSNIFRYEVATGELEAVSNAETGFFRPVPKEDGSLIVFEYTGLGFVPTIIDPIPLEDVSAIHFLGNDIARKHPVVQAWSVVKTLRDQPFEEIVTHRGKYRPYRELALESAYPVVEGFKDYAAFGWQFNFSDPGQLNHLSVTASYTLGSDSPNDQKLHFNAEYSAINWYARYWHNDADFYDLFGPTKSSRKGDAFMVGYEKALIFDDPRELRVHADLAYFTGLDTLPSNQNVAIFAFEKILSAEAALAKLFRTFECDA